MKKKPSTPVLWRADAEYSKLLKAAKELGYTLRERICEKLHKVDVVTNYVPPEENSIYICCILKEGDKSYFCHCYNDKDVEE